MTSHRPGLSSSLARLQQNFPAVDDPARDDYAARFLAGMPWYITRADILAHLPSDAPPRLRAIAEQVPESRPAPTAAKLIYAHARPTRGRKLTRGNAHNQHTLEEDLADLADAYARRVSHAPEWMTADGADWVARQDLARSLSNFASASGEDIRAAIPEDAPDGFRDVVELFADILAQGANTARPLETAWLALDPLAALRAAVALAALYRRTIIPPPPHRARLRPLAPRAPALRPCAA